jgi:branched-chain amino acid aminotransferase
MKLWLNGTCCAEADARIAVDERGFLLGEGLFETLAIVRGMAIDLDAHLDRLTRDAGKLSLTLPVDRDALERACKVLITENNLQDSEWACMRITLAGGPAPRGLLPFVPGKVMPRPTLMITVTSMGRAPASLSAIVSSVTVNETSPSVGIKKLGYIDNIWAKRQAATQGADDAILLNTKGRVAEATTANIFVVLSDGSLVTPPVSEGALAGITRARLIMLARQSNIDLRESPLPVPALKTAREILLVNSLIGVCPLHRLDEMTMNENGVIGRRLSAAYHAFINEELKRMVIPSP